MVAGRAFPMLTAALTDMCLLDTLVVNVICKEN
jgi:hypothetical protein